LANSRRLFSRAALGIVLSSWLSLWVGCAKEADKDPSPSGCPAISGTAWVPTVTTIGAANHDSSAQVTEEVLPIVSGPVIGYAQAAPAAVEVTVSIPMNQDLGTSGSFSLIAQVKNPPSKMTVYPALVYLSDGTHDFINLARGGVAGSGDCADSGYFTGSVAANSKCQIQWPSAYYDRHHWEQHWTYATGGGWAVDTFPTCHWSNGNEPSATDAYEKPACVFNTSSTGFLTSEGKLISGVSYTAKYILLSSSAEIVTGKTASLEIRLVKKTSSNPDGAIDVNAIMVGSSVIQDSHTSKGKSNLNLLFGDLHSVFNQVGLKLGAVRVFEWACSQNGDAYANLDTSELNTMISMGSSLIAASAKGLNLFFIHSFTNNSSIQGMSSIIGGPYFHRTPLSGVVVPTFGKLDQYNATCTDSSCSTSQQDADFRQLAPTIAHEMGHYLGLNHPTDLIESTNTLYHDLIDDTPICTTTKITSSLCANDTHIYSETGLTCPAVCSGYDSKNKQFCPNQFECQFNHLMFRTTKSFAAGTDLGDGNLISPHAKGILSYHPLFY